MNCTSGFLNETEQKACDLPGFQETYWIAATVANSCSLVGLVRLGWEFVRNKRARRQPITYFYVMLLGDLLFCLTYLSYHMNNTIELSINGFVNLSDSQGWCASSWFFATQALLLEFFGLVIISYYPYRIVVSSKSMSRKQSSLRRTDFVKFLSSSFVCAVLWFAVGMALDQVGSYKGLYCGAKSWATIQGGFLFFYPSVAFAFMIFFYYNTWKKLKRASYSASKGASSGGGAGGSTTVDPKIAKAAKNVMNFGFLMVGLFFLTWGPLTLASLCNVLGYDLPIQLEMFAGNMTKWKGLLDSIVILRMPQLRHKSATRSVAPSSAVSSNQSGQSSFE